jgi:hypothetical protein
VYENATDCVDIKGEKIFSVTLYILRIFAIMLPLALSIFLSPLSVM